MLANRGPGWDMSALERGPDWLIVRVLRTPQRAWHTSIGRTRCGESIVPSFSRIGLFWS